MADPHYTLPPPLTIPEPVILASPATASPTFGFYTNDKATPTVKKSGRPLSLESLPSAVPFLQLLYLQDADPPPDGGYGYVIVLVASVCNFILFGMVSSWGVWQLWKWNGPGAGNKVWQRDAPWALVGASALACLFGGGLLVGKPIRKLGRRTCLLIGACLASGGLALASFATHVWQLVLTQGVLFGIGGSLVFYSTLPLVTQWFLVKRKMVIVVCMLASGLGAMVFAPLTWVALSRLGRSNTLRVFAVVCFVGFGMASALVRPWKKKTNSSASFVTGVVDVLREGSVRRGLATIARSNKFKAVWIHTTVLTAVYMVMLMYLPVYATSAGVSPLMACIVLGCVVLVDTVARIGIPVIATQFAWDRLNTLLTLMVASLFVIILWFASAGTVLFTTASLVVIIPIAGSLSMTLNIATHLVDYDQIPDILCAIYTSQAIGSLLGPVVFGWVVDALAQSRGKLSIAQVVLHVFIFMSIACVIALMVMRKRGVVRRMHAAVSVFLQVEKPKENV